MRRSVNAYLVLSIQIHTKELQQLTTGSSFTSLARDLTVGLDFDHVKCFARKHQLKAAAAAAKIEHVGSYYR